MPKQNSRVLLTRHQPVTEFIADFQLVDFRDWKSLTAPTFAENNDKLKETIEMFFSSDLRINTFNAKDCFQREKHSFFISRLSNPSYSPTILSKEKISWEQYLLLAIFYYWRMKLTMRISKIFN